MANEILYAGLADQRTVEQLSGNFLEMIADRNALPNHDALIYVGDAAKTGTTTWKVPHVGLNAFDLPTAIAEGVAGANTAFTDNSSTIAVACFQKSYERGDVAKFTDKLGILNAERFAQDAVVSSAMRLTNLIANVTDDFATVIGSTGVDLTLAQFVAAINALEINSQGQISEGSALAILHTVQVGDLRTAMLSAGGAAQWMPASQEMLQVRGTGYRGRYMGIDIFASPQVPTANAGADRAGGLFVKGAVLWADMSVETEGDANSLVIGNKVLFERERTAKSRLTAYVSSSYFGVSKGIDLLGVSITTDA